MSSNRWLSLVFLLALAAGCSGHGSASGNNGLPAQVELGTGSDTFEPLAPGGDIVLHTGPQGGHHFIVHARMQGLDPGDPTMPGLPADPATRFTVFDSSDQEVDVNMTPYRLGYEDAGDGWYQLSGGRIAQVSEDAVAGLYDHRVHIVVEVTDDRGAQATDDRWLVAIHPPADAGP